MPVFLEGYQPPAGSTGNIASSNIEFYIVDPDGLVDQIDIDAYVEINGGGSVLAYDGLTDNFLSPYNGSASSISFMAGGSIDGYDAYRIMLDPTSDFPHSATVECRTTIAGGLFDGIWQFSIVSAAPPLPPLPSFVAPEILNRNPAPHTPGILPTSLISMDIVDQDGDLRLDSILITVEGETAFESGTFFPPYNGPSALLSATTISGKDGYHIVLDNTDEYSDIVVLDAYASDVQGNSIQEKWSFLVDIRRLNTLYFSDGYGVKKICIKDLAGESQNKTRKILDGYTIPSIPSPIVTSISGQFVDNNFYLISSHDGYGVTQAVWGLTTSGLGTWGGSSGDPPTGFGVAIVKNEVESNVFSQGSRVSHAQMTSDGTLYAVNTDRNRVEVFYGADQRFSRTRPPDFWYDASSTPSILDGYITGIHLVPRQSSICPGASRLYVATSKGATRIETWDLEDPIYDGYSSGQDAYGVSFTYSIPGGTGPDPDKHFSIIGGSAERVASIHSDEDFNVFLVATDDGYGNGGVTQVSITGNRQIAFMSEGLGTLPNMSAGIVRDSIPTHIRDIFGRKP